MKRIIANDDRCCWFWNHKWVEKKLFNFSTYSQCSKCGARKADIVATGIETGEKIRISWLLGLTNIIKRTPVNKEKTDG